MKGTTIQLSVKTITSYDPFGAPIETETLVDIPDVLVGQPTSDDVDAVYSAYGKHIAYSLGIPKGDTHNWEDAEVVIWGNRYKTIGYPVTAEQANIPLRWGQVVKVERYG